MRDVGEIVAAPISTEEEEISNRKPTTSKKINSYDILQKRKFMNSTACSLSISTLVGLFVLTIALSMQKGLEGCRGTPIKLWLIVYGILELIDALKCVIVLIILPMKKKAKMDFWITFEAIDFYTIGLVKLFCKIYANTFIYSAGAKNCNLYSV